MNGKLHASIVIAALVLSTPAVAQITFYEREGFRGRAYTAEREVRQHDRRGFDGSSVSVIVARGPWEVCEDSGFRGRCVVLQRGNYDSLRGMGLSRRVGSMRPVSPQRQYSNRGPDPYAGPAYQYRQRPNERYYQARVTQVRAVLGPPEQRCWVERDRYNDRYNDRDRGSANVGGAVAGAIIGGILGHQVGGGSGRDVATAGGAIAGALVGANSGRDSDYGRQYNRCEDISSGEPAYWDVDYVYAGVTHRMQMSEPPGATIPVNRRGEPRF